MLVTSDKNRKWFNFSIVNNSFFVFFLQLILVPVQVLYGIDLLILACSIMTKAIILLLPFTSYQFALQ